MTKYQKLRLVLTDEAKQALFDQLAITLYDAEYDSEKDDPFKTMYLLSSRVPNKLDDKGEPVYPLAAYDKRTYRVEIP